MEDMVDDQGNDTVVVAQNNSVNDSVGSENSHTPQVMIKANQQSVIQTTSGASALQAVQLSKGNVILLNKTTGSVIQTTSGGAQLQTVQVLTGDDSIEEDSKKRREILARRPSYRKILSELSADSSVISSDVKEETSSVSESSSQEANETANAIAVGGHILVPAGAIQIGSQGEGIAGLQTLTMTNASGGTTGAIVQYAQGQDGQFFVPVTVSAADLQAYQIRTSGGSGSLSQGVVVAPASSIQSPQQMVEEASRKRELRLMKNREAARECRRKKKEYIKCLENRVAVLENQNKALIEELKSLKELYCQKND